MTVEIRRATHQDIGACARINYEAFKGISDRHQFPTDFATLDFATEITDILINSPSYFDIVAENSGEVVGCGFMDERNAIRGIGPVSVDRTFQGKGTGRQIMKALLERGQEAPGIRLVQESFNLASLSLYISLGFEVKEPLVLMEGMFSSPPQYDFEVRPLSSEDIDECQALCNRVYGCDRTCEIEYALNHLSPLVTTKQGRIVAYTCAVSTFGHSVAETAADLQALLLGAAAYSPGEVLCFHLPVRYAGLFRWCLQEGLRALKPLAVMAVGEYQQPVGCVLPSYLY
ncbi:MAG: GNAT family N-acetyltransferase [Oscillatoriales cyanobacterium]|uniref:GNAT family N-acetyltransferase n=1 Tax=Microcoleus anatoxicus PTRS2 TaxID=2705321 RepID=A0ABU8YFU9_9CYAN|nr:MAG: GNAT family N-acetyltransferase [Oscillatoriales cyanobacterium]TAD97639.1 MAG: GNAT family N-acetyltransferase [Oscillatoriales cyanobacterium]TAE05483.1 MAG: GNAT family N-acetyltransferase [Oscillatoriales cyanobacterium]TAF06304.1 MAG: GNAT family N-acetyltransferase [Oscillatoriales cyanobacterium]TAF46097.1 MAG: GNAT family N-acetyltransferase [Oscillatoriales cyanobacterium]